MAEAKTVKLSSADRVLYPEDGITKGDLFEYYGEVGPTIVPAPARPSVHDEALPARHLRRGVLPEAGAQGHAGWIPTRQFRT